MKEGYYWLLKEGEPPTRVYYYENPDTGEKGFSYNRFTGVGFLPEADLTADTVIKEAVV